MGDLRLHFLKPTITSAVQFSTHLICGRHFKPYIKHRFVSYENWVAYLILMLWNLERENFSGQSSMRSFSDVTWASWCFHSSGNWTVCPKVFFKLTLNDEKRSSAPLWENPLVIGGFPSQRTSNVEWVFMTPSFLWISLFNTLPLAT